VPTDTPRAEPRWSAAPYFIVDDLPATADWYRDRLGFRYERLWGDPPDFTIVLRAGVAIMLGQVEGARMAPNGRAGRDEGTWDAYIWVDDADALHAEYSAAGVTVVRPPFDQPYGCRDFEVVDPNGYRLCFGHDTSRREA
jgi:predicted enzyme related to lactoylglutathione lyase